VNAVKDADLKNKIIEQLLNDGDLTASEYYAMTSKNPVTVKGLEDKQVHRKNIKRLADIENNEAKYGAVIETVNKEIGILNKLYTNSRNVRFDRTLAKYRGKKISDSKFYSILEKYVADINANPEKYNNITKITLDDYPNIKLYLSMVKESHKTNNERVSMELQSLIGTLKSSISYSRYKQIIDNTNNFQDSEKVMDFVSAFLKANPDAALKYKNLNKLAAINEFTKLLNPIDLISEQRRLVEKIKFALSYDNTEAEICFITDFKKYFADYLTASLTQDDWIYVKENLNLFLQIYAKYAAYDNLKELEPDFAELNEYYDVNTHRNEIFLSNIFAPAVIPLKNGIHVNNKMDSGFRRNDNKDTSATPSPLAGEGRGEGFAVNAYDILSAAKEVKIAVTGGYHSEGLKELLSQKGITSIVITPNVTTDITAARAKYEELIKEQAKFPSEALAYILMSNTAYANQVAKILQAAVSLGLSETEINNLVSKANAKIENGKIIISGKDDKGSDFYKEINLTAENHVEMPKIENALTPFLNAADIFKNPVEFLNDVEIGILKAIGSLLSDTPLGEPGPVAAVEQAGLQNAPEIASAPMSEFAYYPAFIQVPLLRKELAKDKSQIGSIDTHAGSVVPSAGIFDPKILERYPVKPLYDDVNYAELAEINKLTGQENMQGMTNEQRSAALREADKRFAELAKTPRKRIKLKLNDGEIISAAGVIEEPDYRALAHTPKAFFDIEYKNGKYSVINTLYIARDEITITPAEDGYFYIETPYADTRFSLPRHGSKDTTDEQLVADAKAILDRINSKSKILAGEVNEKQLAERDFNGRTFAKIVGFTTFSGNTKGVENNKDAENKIRQYLLKLIEENGKENILVVCGATDFGGVHNVYNVAQELGLATMGLVSLAGLKECPQDIRKCDYYYVEDKVIPWEGAEAGDWGSESDKFVDLIDELYAFGGGAQAIQEIKNVNKQNKPVRVIFGINTTFSAKGQAEMSLIRADEQGSVKLNSLIESIQRKIDAENNESKKNALLKELKEAQKTLGFSIEDMNSLNIENKRSDFKEFSFKQGEIASFEADFDDRYPSVRFNVALIDGKYAITDLTYNNVVKKNISIINTPNGFYIDSDYSDLKLSKILTNTSAAPLTSDATLNKWYGKILIKLFGNFGLRIVQIAIAPLAESGALSAIYSAWAATGYTTDILGITDNQGNKIAQKFLAGHKDYNETTKNKYLEGLFAILNSALSDTNGSRFAKNAALKLALIKYHAKWNKENPKTPLAADIDNTKIVSLRNMQTAVVDGKEIILDFRAGEEIGMYVDDKRAKYSDRIRHDLHLHREGISDAVIAIQSFAKYIIGIGEKVAVDDMYQIENLGDGAVKIAILDGNTVNFIMHSKQREPDMPPAAEKSDLEKKQILSSLPFPFSKSGSKEISNFYSDPDKYINILKKYIIRQGLQTGLNFALRVYPEGKYFLEDRHFGMHPSYYENIYRGNLLGSHKFNKNKSPLSKDEVFAVPIDYSSFDGNIIIHRTYADDLENTKYLPVYSIGTQNERDDIFFAALFNSIRNLIDQFGHVDRTNYDYELDTKTAIPVLSALNYYDLPEKEALNRVTDRFGFHYDFPVKTNKEIFHVTLSPAEYETVRTSFYSPRFLINYYTYKFLYQFILQQQGSGAETKLSEFIENELKESYSLPDNLKVFSSYQENKYSSHYYLTNYIKALHEYNSAISGNKTEINLKKNIYHSSTFPMMRFGLRLKAVIVKLFHEIGARFYDVHLAPWIEMFEIAEIAAVKIIPVTGGQSYEMELDFLSKHENYNKASEDEKMIYRSALHKIVDRAWIVYIKTSPGLSFKQAIRLTAI
ncbi:MAG: hypothetical protein FWC57_02565, partial [Endomicrobia bacterium]|nr:hypothetical protein [Endomicrobiia bacterium]